MEIFVNQNKIDFELDGNETLKMVINEVKSFLKKQDVSITNITINDVDIAEVENMSISQVEKINFIAKNSTDLLLESIQELNRYIPNMNNGIKKVIGYLNEDEDQRAMDLIISVIDGLEWIYNVLISINEVIKEEYKIDILNENFCEYEERLEGVLESLEEKDMIMLTDLLEFEILEILSNISENLPDVYEKIIMKKKKDATIS